MVVEEEPKIKKHKGTLVPDLDEGETGGTINEHTKQAQKEMSKGTRNYMLIKDLMGITFKYRRISVVDGVTQAVDKIMETSPALQLVTEVSFWLIQANFTPTFSTLIVFQP